jgi:hypothetical protein
VLLLACGGSSNRDGFGSGSGSSSGSGGSSGNGSSGDGSFGDDGGTVPISPDSGCATASAKAARAPVYLLFVQDGSGSMGMEHKWDADTAALKAMFQTFQNDPGIGVGLIVFADTMDMSLATGPGPYPEPGIDVPLGYVDATQVSALDQRLSGSPLSNTPTYYALQGGYGELEGFTPASPLQPDGTKVLVLITDGVPTDHNCSIRRAGTNYPANPCVVMAGQELTKGPSAGPILTFVIGVGQFPSAAGADFDPAFLGNLALAGGGAPMGCNPNETQNASSLCYFEVDPTQAGSAAQLQQTFTNALQAIRGQVLSCTFPLKSTGLGQLDPSKVNVDVNGMTVLQGGTDGWTYDNPANPMAIILHGKACDAVKNQPNAQVSIVVGCATQTAK